MKPFLLPELMWSFLQNADSLAAKYNDATIRLGLKYNQTKAAKDRAGALRLRAARLYQGTYEKIERLRSEDQSTARVFSRSRGVRRESVKSSPTMTSCVTLQDNESNVN